MPQDRQTEIFPFYGRAGARLGRPSGQTQLWCVSRIWNDSKKSEQISFHRSSIIMINLIQQFAFCNKYLSCHWLHSELFMPFISRFKKNCRVRIEGRSVLSFELLQAECTGECWVICGKPQGQLTEFKLGLKQSKGKRLTHVQMVNSRRKSQSKWQ